MCTYLRDRVMNWLRCTFGQGKEQTLECVRRKCFFVEVNTYSLVLQTNTRLGGCGCFAILESRHFFEETECGLEALCREE